MVPVFRSEVLLESFVTELMATMDMYGAPYEILLIEDCGGDNSWDVIRKISKQFQLVKGIRLSRNFGQHSAVLCGIREATGEIIVTMDDDGQHPCEEIPNLLECLGEGVDVVYGTPIDENHNLFRNKASVFTKWVLKHLMGVPNAVEVGSFRAFRTKLREGFDTFQGPNVNIDIMLTWVTENISSIKVTLQQREHGKSGYSYMALVNHAINMITGFSGLPLRIASIAGILFAMLGFFILIYVFATYILVGSAVPGFAFLASIITIFSGVQLLTIGIIGEYISKIHFRSMNRPPYIIREKSNQ